MEDVPDLEMYLRNTTNFTSPSAQMEMAEMFSHQILRMIISEIQQNEFYAVIADGTQDVAGQEQESFVLRHVDSDLYEHEDFIGLYEIPSTTGDVLARTLFDVLSRNGLSISNMRAQTYDGAANMSGCFSGCQARVQERQPLALFFHCGSHACNLVMQHAVTSCQLIRDSLQWLNELGVLMKRSGKYKAIFLAICESIEDDDDDLHPTVIKPLCATRWLCRLEAIQSALDQYPVVLQSLQEMASGVTNTATKANGLLDRFQKGKVFLGLTMAAKPVAILEQLNSALQAKSANVSGMVEAVKTSSTHISIQRTDEAFHQLFTAAVKKCEEYQLAYRSMEHAVRLLFPQVLVLLKLLLVCPVSSCECECSFSALRRLKTWLRATMAQSRLNHVPICHVHRERLDNVNVNEIAKLFAAKTQIRKKLFGVFE